MARYMTAQNITAGYITARCSAAGYITARCSAAGYVTTGYDTAEDYGKVYYRILDTKMTISRHLQDENHI